MTVDPITAAPITVDRITADPINAGPSTHPTDNTNILTRRFRFITLPFRMRLADFDGVLALTGSESHDIRFRIDRFTSAKPDPAVAADQFAWGSASPFPSPPSLGFPFPRKSTDSGGGRSVRSLKSDGRRCGGLSGPLIGVADRFVTDGNDSPSDEATPRTPPRPREAPFADTEGAINGSSRLTAFPGGRPPSACPWVSAPSRPSAPLAIWPLKTSLANSSQPRPEGSAMSNPSVGT
jgi:hypothetical protein